MSVPQCCIREFVARRSRRMAMPMAHTDYPITTTIQRAAMVSVRERACPVRGACTLQMCRCTRELFFCFRVAHLSRDLSLSLSYRSRLHVQLYTHGKSEKLSLVDGVVRVYVWSVLFLFLVAWMKFPRALVSRAESRSRSVPADIRTTVSTRETKSYSVYTRRGDEHPCAPHACELRRGTCGIDARDRERHTRHRSAVTALRAAHPTMNQPQ